MSRKIIELKTGDKLYVCPSKHSICRGGEHAQIYLLTVNGTELSDDKSEFFIDVSEDDNGMKSHLKVSVADAELTHKHSSYTSYTECKAEYKKRCEEIVSENNDRVGRVRKLLEMLD